MSDASFLGVGWSFPVSFTKGGSKLVTSCRDENIRQSLEILLSTEVFERIIKPYFGCGLRQLMYRSFSSNLSSHIKDKITNAVLIFEPRVTLICVEVAKDPNEDSLLLINLEYIVRSTNARSNLVYPFYLKEAGKL